MFVVSSMTDTINEDMEMIEVVEDEQTGGRWRNEEEEVNEVVVQSIPSNYLNTRMLENESGPLDERNGMKTTDRSQNGSDNGNASSSS